MIQHRWRGQAIIGAPRGLRDIRVALGQAFYMGFVDQRLVPAVAQWLRIQRKKRRIRHHRFRHERCAVPAVKGQVGLGCGVLIAERGSVIAERSVKFARVGVDQQLVAIEPMPGVRVIRSGHAIAVQCSGREPRQISMPHRSGAFGQGQAHLFGFAIRGKETQKHLRGMFREHRKICPTAVKMCAKLHRAAGFKSGGNGGVVGHQISSE